MLGLEIPHNGGIGNRGWVKSSPLVLNDYRHSLARFTPAMNLNEFDGIESVAMKNRIVESLRSASPTACSSPRTQCDSSISRIIRSTSGEIASISLGIRALISKEESFPCVRTNSVRKHDGMVAFMMTPKSRRGPGSSFQSQTQPQISGAACDQCRPTRERCTENQESRAPRSIATQSQPSP